LKNVKLLAEEELPMQVDIKYVPDVAMQFNSCDEAQKFCNEYAYMELFSILVAGTYQTISKNETMK
jgi:hypothetical protein